MSVQSWEHFFKPEVRSSGRAFLTTGKVSQSQLSDTEVQTYIRASTSFKVILKSESVSSNTLIVGCTCPLFKKGQFCKHIWAALLSAQEKHADFLDAKTNLEKSTPDLSAVAPEAKISQARIDSQAAFKLKQADYRKEQYQKQKQRLKDQKKSKNKDSAEYPPEIEKALEYFLANGFPLRESMTRESIGLAMRKLAKVFHPDVGGSHNEILELNHFTEILTKYSKF